MSDTLVVRDFTIDFLRRELVGPSPLSPDVQPNGEEILRPQDPPRQRYGAGVLFPSKVDVPSHDASAPDEDEPTEANSPEPTGILDSTVDTDSRRTGDSTPETDQDVNLANQFLPSAMGLSALVDVPDGIEVEISGATYRQGDAPEIKGQISRRKPWLRQPFNEVLSVTSGELLEGVRKSLEKPVVMMDGQPALVLHIVSRAFGGTARRRLVTFTLVNRLQCEGSTPRNTECFFQCAFSVSSAGPRGCFLSYPEQSSYSRDAEELSLQLLHLHKQSFAVGHGCAAEWADPDNGRTSLIRTEVLPTHEVKPVLHTEVKELDLSMSTLAHGERDEILSRCRKLADAYRDWIVERQDEALKELDSTPELQKTAFRHLENCRTCLSRIVGGIELISQDPEIESAFRLMNEAMQMQQIHYELSSQQLRRWVAKSGRLTLRSRYRKPNYDDSSRKWRAFQLAFVLMNLKALADPQCNERDIADVIWFPTGGGKTEAYLGLSAFTIFLRRRRDSDSVGTTVLMRYTLRLLSTQQFQRAASLICACEIIRRRRSQHLGSCPFTIGLWVGGEVTPNRESHAVNALRQLQRDQGPNKFVLVSCPWCGAAMGPQRFSQHTRVKGYRLLSHPQRVRHICEDRECDFSSEGGLPVAVIDEHIYESPPTLLIGTVDKFAMLAFRPEARSIFGIGKQGSPPDLIIQDELHLISGPLGSMVGHYETVVDALCTRDHGGHPTRPKVIGSTATISRAESQVKALYGRSSFLFPPQALRIGDSFFAAEDSDADGRTYVGVFASALPSHVTSQIRTMSALIQAPRLAGSSSPASIDPYWTMMAYFNSLRELGHAATLIRADIREYLNAMWDRLGLRLDVIRQSGTDLRRFINRDVELTSRVSSSDIPTILQQLFEKYSGPSNSEAIDVCFATNMIQVGLDVPRLSLMTIVGQPKTTAEYIQASSRIGRRVDSPGVVVTNFNPSRSRDRSHYEHFRTYHQTLYKHVEPTSVTPFAVSVRERALHALLIILCRFWGGSILRDRPTNPPDDLLIRRIKRTIRQRVMSADPNEWPKTEAHIDEIIRRWTDAPRSIYGDFGPPTEELPMMHPAGNQLHPQWPEAPYPTPSSMRNVDASCSARHLTSGYGS